MLIDKIRVEQATDVLDVEDIFSESLGLFPDETRNSHGDPGSTVIYKSARFGDIRMSVADPSNEDERKLFAHYAWNAGILLAELISSDFAWNVAGEKVLELGAGLGLAGITAALCGAANVDISDYPSPVVLKNIEANVKRNLPEAPKNLAAVHGHIWGSFEDALSKNGKGRYSRIFAADCFWMPWEHENLISSMLYFLSDFPSSRIYAIAGFHTGRAKLAPFFADATNRGLEFVQLYEMDVEGNIREWQTIRDGGKEDVSERNKWVSFKYPIPCQILLTRRLTMSIV